MEEGGEGLGEEEEEVGVVSEEEEEVAVDLKVVEEDEEAGEGGEGGEEAVCEGVEVSSLSHIDMKVVYSSIKNRDTVAVLCDGIHRKSHLVCELEHAYHMHL